MKRLLTICSLVCIMCLTMGLTARHHRLLQVAAGQVASIVDYLFNNFGPDVVAPFGRLTMVRGLPSVSTNGYTQAPAHGQGATAFLGGGLLSDGTFYNVPYSATNAIIWNSGCGAVSPPSSVLHPILNKY